ncbi:MAG: DNA-processing protein DprA [Clostridiales bacterium]|nr:DNA-processing protein DprA [Clostridiales bacterium]MCF8022158.1 DNA-processing protein DprA [Clostridiales bacterium]
MDQKQYLLGWQLLLPGSSAKIWSLVNYFDSFEAAWKASGSELGKVMGSGSSSGEKLIKRRESINLVEEINLLDSKNIEFVCYYDKNYPETLKDIYDPPPGIFVKGELQEFNAVSLVGSRKPTPNGIKIAEKLGCDLARAGVAVVSGMARGIDAAAHKGALDAGGYTIAVLGCGVDVLYPPENDKLSKQIASTGALLSEFPPGTAPEAWHFPVRNRVISGLSKAVVVVEAAERSGALITADSALDQGRDVAAVPGNILNRMSKGPNGLIKQGAKLVESAADILNEIGLYKLFSEEELSKCNVSVNLSDIEQKIFKELSEEPLYLDDIVNRSCVAPKDVLSILMYLEIKGLIKQLPGKMFIKYGA